MKRWQLGVVAVVFGFLAYALISIMVTVFAVFPLFDCDLTITILSFMGWVLTICVGIVGVILGLLAAYFLGVVIFQKNLPTVTLLKIE